jgi:Leucine-rich repeat (LRR) protein
MLSLLSFVSSDKSIDCAFSNDDWHYVGQPLKTCNVHSQAIDNVDYTIASSVDSTVKGFDINNNPKVEFLPANLSEKFPNLIATQLRNCSIKSIDEHHLEDLHKLIVLNLGWNKIERIDSGAFKDNVKLEKLQLGFNKIKHLCDDLFSSLHNLKQLHLQGNQIRYIDPFLFYHPTNLEEINLSNNKIRFLHPETFSTLSNLKSIFISDNQLESIDGSLLANNMQLERIWFENNKLRSIDAEMFDDKESLCFVNLEGNSCINGYFMSSFESMKTEIKAKCSPSIDSLKRELSNLKKEFSDQKAQLDEVIATVSQVDSKTATLTASLNLKEQELEQCREEKAQEVQVVTTRAEKWKEVLDTCKSFMRN